MKRSRFSEEQIIAMLKEQEAGMLTADVCRNALLPNLGPPVAGVFRLGHGDGLTAPPG